MWRLGVFLVISVLFCCSSSADFEYASGKLQRLRRSPHYHCPPYFYDGQPRHFPGPPPPPYWQPPPRNYFQERQDFQNEPLPQNSPSLNQNSRNQNSNQNSPNQKYTQEVTQENPQISQEETKHPENKPCDKCEKGQDSAISNARSVSGSAIAVAITGKGSA